MKMHEVCNTEGSLTEIYTAGLSVRVIISAIYLSGITNFRDEILMAHGHSTRNRKYVLAVLQLQ